MPVPSSQTPDLDTFLANFRSALVVLSGPALGLEYILDQRTIRVGRGPGVDLAIDDPSLQTVHAQIEFENGAFRVRAEAPEAHLLLNGGSVTSGELKHEDRLDLGSVAFSFALEPRALPRPLMR